MLTARLTVALLGSAILNLSMTTCRSPGEADKAEKAAESKAASSTKVELPGVDSSQLSPREEARWSSHVRELLAPCEDTPVSIELCVKEKKDCSACRPAAEFLLQQVMDGKTQAQVNLAYKARFSPSAVEEIDVLGSPMKGPADAPITIVEWADFECPACRMASPVLDEVVDQASDVRLVFKNYPLDIHENAVTAARASVAADLQGKFWEMHHAMFESTLPLTESTLIRLAEDLELDVARFKADLNSEKVADRVAKDRKDAELVKLRATPTIYVNGREFTSRADLKQGLVEWIELERQLIDATEASSDQPTQPQDAPSVDAEPKP